LKLIDLIVGARPNFIKIASIIRAMESHQANGGFLEYRLVHTGQHYDRKMSDDFFDQLGIPDPHTNLKVGSGTQAEQTAGIMVGYEKLLFDKKPNLCLVVGDVTSTMACAITAQKLQVPVAHVEGGIRSGDWTMPEEINRMVTDSITNYFFTTSELAGENLGKSGVSEDRIFFVGNTMIDTLVANMSRLKPPDFFESKGFKEKEYFVLTLHRPSNVDREAGLIEMLGAISHGVRDLPVIFPVHPRSAKKIVSKKIVPENIYLVNPQSYLEFIYLVKHAKAVITDSGGITEEATLMGVPCMTIRDSTERPETVTIGTNELLGTDPAVIKTALDRLFSGEWKHGAIPPLWDGKAGERIIKHLESIFKEMELTSQNTIN
jgi:UDP-N-acetylglucosamine 2-epimerase (non-hydrolysing)